MLARWREQRGPDARREARRQARAGAPQPTLTTPAADRPVNAARASYFAYRGAAAVANAVPERVARPIAEAAGRALVAVPRVAPTARRPQPATRHDRGIEGKALQRAVSATFASYGRYWLEMLPPAARRRGSRWSPASTPRAGSTSTPRSTAGNGLILALPHLGGCDFAAAWLAGRGVAPIGRRRAGRAAGAVRVVRRRARGDRHGGRAARARRRAPRCCER